MSEILVPTRRGFLAGLASALAAPVIVRYTSLMPVKVWPADFPLEPLPAFGFESLLPPEGFSYQWATKTVMGDETLGNLRPMLAAGWKLVPSDRWNHKFAINGPIIEHGGCVLLERPAIVTAFAREKEIAASQALNREWFQQAKNDGFDVTVRRPHSGTVMTEDGRWRRTVMEEDGRWRRITQQDLEKLANEKQEEEKLA